VRGLLLAVTSLLGYWGLTFMPVGEFTAIAMITPLAVTLLAALWLGEKVSGLRWLLVAGGFAGTVIIVRPGGALFGWHTLIPLVMVVCYAFFQILTSRLAQTEDAMSMHNYTGWVGTVVASLALPFFWVTPDTLQEWSLLLLMGVMGTVGHYLLILAYRRAPPATLMPLLYVQIGFAMFAGWLVFAHMPDGVSLLGMALIAVCGAASGWLALRENQARPTTDFQTSALREPLEV
jgi:drug/metabolite transporter (DMT)-like permease